MVVKPIMSTKLTLAPRFAPRLLTVVITVVALTAFQSCANKIPFNTSTIVPTADGRVKVKRDNNNNYSIDINIRHLANPKKLVPAKNMYIVWAETQQNGTKNIGRLNSSSGFLSRTLKSSLNTVLPYKPTMIFITAEDEPGIEYPGSQVVMTTKNF